jgi:hypothetical protein
MALTTESVDPKKSGPAKPAEAKGDTKLPEPVAAPGATDPAVQKLLADQQTAVSNGDADGIRDINAKLNELGYK